MSKMIPIGDNIIITQDTAATETETGIVLPSADSENNKPQTGKVIAVGCDVGKSKYTSEPSVKRKDIDVGDTVYFTKYAGNQVNVDGQDYLVMKESDILITLKS